MEKNMNEKIVTNPFIHEKLKISRQEFLSFVKPIKAITREPLEGFFLSIYPTNIKEWVRLEQFHHLVNTANLSVIDEYNGYYNIAVSVPAKLYSWFANNQIGTIRKQVIQGFLE